MSTERGFEWRAGTRWVGALLARVGVPDYAGIVVFFCSALGSTQFLWAIRHDSDDLGLRLAAALATAIAAASLTVAGVRRLWRPDPRRTLARLSLTLAPGLLFIFAPFLYAQRCRWTDSCVYWSDVFLLLGIGLGIAVGLDEWSGSWRRRADAAASAIGRQAARLGAAHRFWLVSLLCLAVLVLRGWERLVYPELFAEGGRFVAGALNEGWPSLLVSYDGYYHIVPRLIALLATSLVPIAYIPVFTVTACFLITAAISAFFVRPCFRWLVPSDAARGAVALLLCLAPGLYEVLGNLPNLHSPLLILLGLLTLKDPAQRYRGWELVLVLLAVLTSGAAAVFAPAVIARCWLRATRMRAGVGSPARAAWDRDLSVPALIALGTMLIVAGMLGGDDPGLARPDAIVGEGFDPLALATAMTRVTAIFFLLHPFAGTVAVSEIILWVPVLVLALGAVVLFGSLLWWHKAAGRRAQALQMTAWLIGPLALLALIGVMRPVGLSMFVRDEHWQHFGWWMRYNYVFGVSGVLLWVMVLRPTVLRPARRLGNVLTVTLCCAYVSQANWYFEARRYGDERRWLNSSVVLERAVRTGCPRTVKVAIYPDRWALIYRAREPDPSCAR